MAAVWATFALVNGLTFDGDWLGLLVIALVIGVANAIVIPLLKLVSIPVRIMTLGLFTLVINVGVVFLVIVVTESLELGVASSGWLATLLGAFLLTIFSSMISMLTKD